MLRSDSGPQVESSVVRGTNCSTNHQEATPVFFYRSTSTASAKSIESTSTCCSRSLGFGTFAAAVLDDSEHMNENNMTCASSRDKAVETDHVGQHPSLKTVCVVDCHTETRIIPNSNEAFVLDNKCFEGHVMLLMRTPDVDHPRDPSLLGPTQQAVSQYFKDKKRRFEFQFQIKLKKVPVGALFLGCELEQSIKLGKLTKGLVNLLLAMVRGINPGFHYSWGMCHDESSGNAKHPPPQVAAGDFEKTHLSFPVEASVDRIVITKPGEIAPVLGEELHEAPESVKRRRRQGAGSVDWNTTDIYTIGLWSAYADWITWRSINVPGVSPFSLCRVTGAQPIYLSVYEVASCTSQDYKRKRPPHMQKDLKIYARLEFSNQESTVGGLAEKMIGRRSIVSFDQSLPDTDSVGSDIETLSCISQITN